jgi:hypothetical protein
MSVHQTSVRCNARTVVAFPVAAVASGAAGGFVLLVLLSVVICCCVLRRHRASSAADADGSSATVMVAKSHARSKMFHPECFLNTFHCGFGFNVNR